MRTETRSTSGTLSRSLFASRVRALAASVAITAVTKPAPPMHKAPPDDANGAAQLHRLSSMGGPRFHFVALVLVRDILAVGREHRKWLRRSAANPVTSKKPTLFYQLVGDLLKMQRHVEAERPCSFEVDHKLAFLWQPEMYRIDNCF